VRKTGSFAAALWISEDLRWISAAVNVGISGSDDR
jgi:hypothetical protein